MNSLKYVFLLSLCSLGKGISHVVCMNPGNQGPGRYPYQPPQPPVSYPRQQPYQTQPNQVPYGVIDYRTQSQQPLSTTSLYQSSAQQDLTIAEQEQKQNLIEERDGMIQHFYNLLIKVKNLTENEKKSMENNVKNIKINRNVKDNESLDESLYRLIQEKSIVIEYCKKLEKKDTGKSNQFQQSRDEHSVQDMKVSIKEQLDDKINRIHSLNDELYKLKQEKEINKYKEEKVNEELEILKKSLNELKDENKRLQNENQKLQNKVPLDKDNEVLKIQQLEIEIQQLKKEKQEVKDLHENSLHLQTSQINKLKAAKEQYDNYIRQQEKKINDQTKMINDLTTNIEQMKKAQKDKELQKGLLISDNVFVEQQKNTIAEYQKMMNDQAITINNLKNEIDTIKTYNKKLLDSYTNNLNALKTLKKELVSFKDKQIKEEDLLNSNIVKMLFEMK
jgi:DNA repair exonuclease SbcCD ATPase subunit